MKQDIEKAKETIRQYVRGEAARGELGIAFTEAARWDITDFIEEQLTKGTPVDIKAPHGGTALSFAASGGAKDVIDILLRHGANVNIQDDFQGFSPLIACVAALHNKKIYLSICRKLIEAGADLSLRDKNGLTAFDWAKERGSKDLLKMLEINIKA